MWTCKNCKEENEDTFVACWKCGTNIDGTPPESPEEFQKAKNEVETGNQAEFPEYVPTYGTTRFILKMVAFILLSAHLKHEFSRI